MSAAADAPRIAAVPAAYHGVWRRSLLAIPGKAPDTTSTVYWLQTADWHGDLRLPVSRPDFSACRSIADCTPAQRHWLARQQGFAGITEVTAQAGAAFCQWHRRVDFQPARPRRDCGRMVFSGGGAVVDEYGVDAEYHETWERLPQSVGDCGAWRKEPAASPGFGQLLLVSGACFFYLRDRATPLPALDDLAAMADSEAGAPLLDMELSFGSWDPAGARGTIRHSTLPWREGLGLARDAQWMQAR